jgi:hypothetical protein
VCSLFIFILIEAQDTSPNDTETLAEIYNPILSDEPQNLSFCISPGSSTLLSESGSPEIDGEGISETKIVLRLIWTRKDVHSYSLF